MNIKDGWKTTEFWSKNVLQAMTMYGTVKGILPPQPSLIVGGILEIAYAVLRTVTKMKGQDVPDAPAQ